MRATSSGTTGATPPNGATGSGTAGAAPSSGTTGAAGSGGATTAAVGAYGERRAVRHLAEAGLRVVDRNWRCPEGEIDIVAWDGETLVFCEVKTRRGTAFGSPAEAVTGLKARRLRRLAARWLATHDTHPREVRFDVIAIFVPPRGAARVDHIREAF